MTHFSFPRNWIPFPWSDKRVRRNISPVSLRVPKVRGAEKRVIL